MLRNKSVLIEKKKSAEWRSAKVFFFVSCDGKIPTTDQQKDRNY